MNLCYCILRWNGQKSANYRRVNWEKWEGANIVPQRHLQFWASWYLTPKNLTPKYLTPNNIKPNIWCPLQWVSSTPWGVPFPLPVLHKNHYSKGQLISKCPIGIFVWTKNQRNYFWISALKFFVPSLGLPGSFLGLPVGFLVDDIKY